MQIQRVRGRDLREALTKAKELAGADALVLSHETTAEGEVTVAIAVERGGKRAASASTVRDAGLADVERALARSGCSPAWIAEISAAVAATGARGSYALDAAAELLGSQIEIAPSPKLASRPLAIALVGPAGVGKTTTVAKLAVRLTRAGRRVGFVATDASRPGAVELLARIAGAMQAPIDVARDGGELCAALDRSRSRDVVLIDTSGRARRDVPALQALGADIARATYLVVPATSSRAALAEAHDAFGDVDALVVTKLDETRVPAASLEFARGARLPLAFLCDGAALGAHLHRADRERVADLLLRGRMA